MRNFESFDGGDLWTLRLALEQMIATNNGGFADLKRAKGILKECRERIEAIEKRKRDNETEGSHAPTN